MAYQNSSGINVTGILTLDSSGVPTGSTVTEHGVVVAGASNALSTVAPGTSGNVFTSNGTSWESAANDGGIVTLNGDTGSATGSTVTLTSGASANSGYTVNFSAASSTVTLNVTDPTSRNTFLGTLSGNATATGQDNVSIGGSNGTLSSLSALTTGNRNLVLGNGCLPLLTEGNNNIGMCGGEFSALIALTTGSNNVALGSNSGPTLTTGSRNICIGVNTGTSFAAGNSSNICIGDGAAGASASNRLQIGKSTGAGTSQLNKSFIHGIRGITTANANAIAVLVDSAGQLGTVSSSIKFKENVEDMGEESADIMSLRPVSFTFKDNGRKGFGLISEEVEKSFPYLCAHDENGEPFSVKYHELPALLLNEIQKMSQRIKELETKLNGQK
jgi:hypothetical protein